MLNPTENIQWERTGISLGRAPSGEGASVVGDPSIVWDPEIGGWRMVLFFDPPGHATSISLDPTGAPETWSAPVPLVFTNPHALPEGRTHKPVFVMDAHEPNRAAVVNGKCSLLTITFREGHKFVQRATSDSLAGPWTLDEGPLFPLGGEGEFDENHADAVTGYWFDDQKCFLYFYMGYPIERQPWPNSPWGSAIGVVVEREGERPVKSGPILAPANDPAHWTAGWLGGFQLVPGRSHTWVAIINASPTAPDRRGNMTSEEPAPSLGGLAFSDAVLPTDGWFVSPQPFEWIEDVPESAIDAGEGVNLWRHHYLDAGPTKRLFYNSGSYGTEQLYSKRLVSDGLD